MPSRDDTSWSWRGSEGVRLVVDPATLSGTIERRGARWQFAGYDGVIDTVEQGSAGCTATVRNHDGVPLNLAITVLADGARFSIDADPDWRLAGDLAWPPPLVPTDRPVQELVLPIRTTQGILHHPDPAAPVHFSLDVNGPNRSALSMPCWAVSTADGGLLTILDTPSDAALDVVSGAPPGAAVGVRWLPALGRFDGPRVLRALLTDPGYVAAALRYRRDIAEAGRLVTLADKIEQRPQVAGLVGAPYFSTGYLPFAEHKLHQVLAGLTDLGYRSGLIGPVDLLQWGAGPWLNDYQPFISEPGYAKIIEQAGYTPFAWFYLEDQLEHDPSFDADTLAVGPDGAPHTGWQNRDYVYRRVCDLTIASRGRALRDRAARYAGLHFDTTTAKELTECWSAGHPMTRDQDRQARHDWLAEVASWGHVVGSESGSDWAFDVIDFCSNNPRKDMETGFPGSAVHVPFQGLVYHDCVISYGWEYDPYNPSYFGGDWSRAKIAYDLMCGNPPTVSPVLGYFPVIGKETGEVSSSWVRWEDPATQALLQAALPVADLHHRVAKAPMADHGYLDETGSVSRTVYADGTEVVVNAGPQPFSDGGRGPVLEPWSWSLDGRQQGIGARHE